MRLAGRGFESPARQALVSIVTEGGPAAASCALRRKDIGFQLFYERYMKISGKWSLGVELLILKRSRNSVLNCEGSDWGLLFQAIKIDIDPDYFVRPLLSGDISDAL